MDNPSSPANLRRAFEKVWSNGGSAGADGQTVAHFARHAETELQGLHEQLRAGSYAPQPVRRAWIAKPGSKEKRPLGIPAVRDRIVQGALRHVLEPIFETEFASPREIVCGDSLCGLARVYLTGRAQLRLPPRTRRQGRAAGGGGPGPGRGRPGGGGGPAPRT